MPPPIASAMPGDPALGAAPPNDPIAVTLDLRNGAKHILAISYIADLATLSVAPPTNVFKFNRCQPRAVVSSSFENIVAR